jgi:protein-tyrosine-phosphatase
VAARRGHDLGAHSSKLLTTENVGAAELVVVMDAKQKRKIRRLYGRTAESVLVLGDLDPEPIDTRVIRDPWGHPEEVFEASYERIDRCLRALIEAARRNTTPSPSPVRAAR